MKLQLKRSNVLENNAAKRPTAEQLEYGELAINYNADDPTMFIKDSSNDIRVFPIRDEYPIIVSDTAPTPSNYEEGTLWWNSDASSAQLFVLYNDPANGGGSDPGGLKWIEASPTVMPGQDIYLPFEGGNLTGNLTLGADPDNPKITFDATDGNATFTGGVNAASTQVSSSTGAYFLCNGDGIYYYNTSGSNTGFILADGSAEFAGQIDITGRGSFAGYGWAIANNGGLSNKTPSGPTVTFSNAGNASFAGTLTAAGAITSGSAASNGVVLDQSGAAAGYLGGVQNWLLSAAGAATLAGVIQQGSYNSSDAAGQGAYIGGGYVIGQQPSSAATSSPIWQGRYGTAVTSQILANGDAVFTGGVSGNYIVANRVTTDANLLQGSYAYSSGTTTVIKGTGIFLGTSLSNVNGASPTGTNIQLGTDGNAILGATIRSNSYDSGVGYSLYRGDDTGGIYFKAISGLGLAAENSFPLRASYDGVENVVIRHSGNAYFAGNITAGNVSDIKFKENITDANPQLADVTALGNSLKNWDWKDEAPLNDELKSKRFLGLIAQEAEQICPGVTYEVGEGEDSYKAINHDILVMKLLGAVAELKAEIATALADI